MKIGFVSLGCPKNLVDSEVMMGQLVERGHELTSNPGDADVIVVNTCGFIDPAKQESVDTILEMAEFKRHGRVQKLIVAGCLVERYRDAIQRELPEVDAVLGTNDISNIAKICAGGVVRPSHRPYLYNDATPRVLATPGHYAYVKIAEGCDHPCSFCVIPQYRGKFRSRRLESILTEADGLFSNGVREINLIGQDTTCYGEDLGMKEGLAQLLTRLAQLETANGKWIRFLYCYPNRVSQKLLDTIAQNVSLVKYIDIPLQHASADVLKRMRRGANGDIFLKLIERIRKTIPNVAIRTSMIVGFPGETARDFEILCDFIQAAQFDRLGAFSYSDEDASASYHLDHKVSPEEIESRRCKLMGIQRVISGGINRSLIGREFDVLVEQFSTKTPRACTARLEGQAPEIDGVCRIGGDDKMRAAVGEFRRLRVTDSEDYDLFGVLVDKVSRPALTEPLFPILK